MAATDQDFPVPEHRAEQASPETPAERHTEPPSSHKSQCPPGLLPSPSQSTPRPALREYPPVAAPTSAGGPWSNSPTRQNIEMRRTSAAPVPAAAPPRRRIPPPIQ